MPIFMDTGGGDIYAAETKDGCIEAMKQDVGSTEVQEWIDEDSISEVSGSSLMNHDNHGEITLARAYELNGERDHGYCIASENC